MVPNGWKLTTVDDIFNIQLGKMLNKTAKTKTPQYAYLGNSNVKWGCFDLSDLKTMHFNEKEIKKFSLKKNDILMCEGGEVGRCAIWDLDNTQIFYQKALHRLRVKQDVIPIYFINYMQSIADTKLLDDYTSRTSIAHLTKEKLSALPVKLPPLPEQQKIAKILTTWDKAINATERLIDNSKQQKKALMQQLLTGKKRLLDDEGKRFEGEWLTKKLVDITTRIQRKSDGNDHPILTISSLSGFMTQKERYSRFMAGESLKKYVLLKNGEFAYNKGNSKTYQFGCIFKLEDFETGLVPNIYVCFKINNGLCEDFYKYLFEADYLKPQLGRLVNTGVRNDGLLNIRPDEFLNTTVPVPPIDEQQKIAAVLTNASREIELLEQQLADLQQEKKALMQQLLTGKKRVLVDGGTA